MQPCPTSVSALAVSVSALICMSGKPPNVSASASSKGCVGPLDCPHHQTMPAGCCSVCCSSCKAARVVARRLSLSRLAKPPSSSGWCRHLRLGEVATRLLLCTLWQLPSWQPAKHPAQTLRPQSPNRQPHQAQTPVCSPQTSLSGSPTSSRALPPGTQTTPSRCVPDWKNSSSGLG